MLGELKPKGPTGLGLTGLEFEGKVVIFGVRESLHTGDLKTALFCISFLRKGEVLTYVGRIHNLKDLKDPYVTGVSLGHIR